MESVLIVSYTEKSAETILHIMKKFSCKNVTIAKTCGDARRLALDYDYDLFIINSPVYNESGESLAKELITNGTGQVILIVKNDIYEYISSNVEDFGVITVPKPISKNLLWIALKISKATNARLKKIQKDNTKLTKKIEDIRIIDRAKCLLISHLNMSEIQAHKYLEKKAMDSRKSKREVAENILKTYEN